MESVEWNKDGGKPLKHETLTDNGAAAGPAMEIRKPSHDRPADQGSFQVSRRWESLRCSIRCMIAWEVTSRSVSRKVQG